MSATRPLRRRSRKHALARSQARGLSQGRTPHRVRLAPPWEDSAKREGGQISAHGRSATLIPERAARRAAQ